MILSYQFHLSAHVLLVFYNCLSLVLPIFFISINMRDDHDAEDILTGTDETHINLGNVVSLEINSSFILVRKPVQH